MNQNCEYTLWIGAYKPTTIPMARLAEYMSELAVLLGETSNVHFVRLDEGSTKIVSKVDDEAIPKVNSRVSLARMGDGPTDAIKAIKNINRKLHEDNTTGRLYEGTSAEIIKFPGREAIEERNFGAVTQQGSLDGTVVRVGGTKETVYVHLQSSHNIYSCLSSRFIAKQLAEYLFTGEVRVFGVGRWIRSETGVWDVDRFQVDRFQPLDDRPLSAILADLRSIPGSEWPSVEDPWAELDRLRNGPDGAH